MAFGACTVPEREEMSVTGGATVWAVKITGEIGLLKVTSLFMQVPELHLILIPLAISDGFYLLLKNTFSSPLDTRTSLFLDVEPHEFEAIMQIAHNCDGHFLLIPVCL